MNKYFDLTRQLQKLWNMKNEADTKSFEKRLENCWSEEQSRPSRLQHF